MSEMSPRVVSLDSISPRKAVTSNASLSPPPPSVLVRPTYQVATEVPMKGIPLDISKLKEQSSRRIVLDSTPPDSGYASTMQGSRFDGERSPMSMNPGTYVAPSPPNSNDIYDSGYMRGMSKPRTPRPSSGQSQSAGELPPEGQKLGSTFHDTEGKSFLSV